MPRGGALVGVELELMGAAIPFRDAGYADFPAIVVTLHADPEIAVHSAVGAGVVAPGLTDIAEYASLDVTCRLQLELPHNADMGG